MLSNHFFLSVLIYCSMFVSSTLAIRIAEKKNDHILEVVGLMIPIIVASFRKCGIDFYTYLDIYNFIHGGGTYPIEIGWVLLNKVAPSFEVLLGISAVLFYGSIYIAIKHVISEDRWLAWLTVLVMSTGFFYNGIRQSISVALVFWGLVLYQEKLFVKSVVINVIAFMFHKTAILILPIVSIYLFFTAKVKHTGFLVFILSIVGVIAFPVIVSIVKHLGIFGSYIDNSRTLIISFNFLLYTLPPIFFFFFRKRIFRDLNEIRIWMKIYYLLFPFQMLGMRIPYADRIAVYFQIVLSLLIPMIVHGYDRGYRSHNLRCMYILWFIVYHIIMGMILNDNGIYPYRYF